MHFKSKKSLGQSFLIDQNIQKKIIEACELKTSDIVLEIGAGRGELTRFIADKVDKVYAIEIDSYLCQILKDKFKDYQNTKIISRDILNFNLSKYLRISNKIKAIGNIPYYITTPIIEHLLKHRDKIETIFITVQKEFAKRIVANPGPKEYGSFSCFVQYYCIPKILFYIKKGSFSPIPKVDSCLLQIKPRQSPAVKVKDEKLFFKVIRASFNKRRKTLRNSLEGVVSLQKLSSFFKKYRIDSNIRPEDLTLKDFARLTNII